MMTFKLVCQNVLNHYRIFSAALCATCVKAELAGASPSRPTNAEVRYSRTSTVNICTEKN